MHAVWRTIRNFAGPLLLALAGIGLAFALFIYVRNDLERDAQLRFERQAADANHIIERRLRTYVDVTHGLKALFEAQDSISRAEFHRYVASLRLKDQYPGFVQLNYARHIRGSEKSSLEASVRADRSLSPDGYPRFRIRPGGERPEYHALIYIEPMEHNEYSFGLDILMVGLRGAAMDNLRESTSVISSGRPLTLGDPPFIGVGMRLPLYKAGLPRETEAQRRAAFIGSVGAGVNVRYLMSGVLDETTMTSMRYRVRDAGPLGSAGGPESRLTLIYDSAQPGPGTPDEDFAIPGTGRTFGVVLPLQFAGRDWRLHFSAPADAFIDRTDARLPFLVLAGGLLCAGLLFAVVYAFASSRQRAVALATDITRELRGSEASLAHAQALARLGSWTLDLDSERMAWSAETYRLLELDPAAAPPRRGASRPASLRAWNCRCVSPAAAPAGRTSSSSRSASQAAGRCAARSWTSPSASARSKCSARTRRRSATCCGAWCTRRSRSGAASPQTCTTSSARA